MADSDSGQPDLSVAEGGSPDIYGSVSTPEGQNAGPTDIEFGGGGGKYGGGFTVGAHDATDWTFMYPVNRKNESGGRNLG